MFLFRFINFIFDALYLLIFARIILSWIRPDPYNPIIRFIYNTTEPILFPFRALVRDFIPPLRDLPIDISPILAILFIQLLRSVIFNLLFTIL